MTTDLADKIVLITGAAGKGIGQATARAFAAIGTTVVITDVHEGRTAKVTAEVATDHPDARVVGYRMDVGDRGEIDAVLATMDRELGAIDILVNNAAVNVRGSIFDYDPDHWDWTVRVNLTGPWYLCRRVMPTMRDARGGVIVNVSSIAPDVGGYGDEGAYAITKGGLNVLTRALAHEGGPHDIRAVTVAVGVVTGTKFIDDHSEVLERPRSKGVLRSFPSAKDVADAIVFLASSRAGHITGESLTINSGAYMRP